MNLRKRWELIKSYISWEDYLGVAILLFGVLGFILEPIHFLHELRAELIGIGITVLIIDNANEAIKRREEKKRLILQMGSPDNAFAIEAVRQLRARDWLLDGSLYQANLGGANLSEGILSAANMRGAHLSGTDMSGAHLTGANLSGTLLWGANFCGAFLSAADLKGAQLSGANLSGATLAGADLQGANLNLADRSEADLTQANLRGVNLTGACLRGACLNETNLSEAILNDAILEDSNLLQARVTIEQLDQARTIEGATMPDETKHE